MSSEKLYLHHSVSQSSLSSAYRYIYVDKDLLSQERGLKSKPISWLGLKPEGEREGAIYMYIRREKLELTKNTYTRGSREVPQVISRR